MEIITYNRNKLNEFIHSDSFNKMPLIPISRHRAISQINNPRADENDILLAVAYEENRMAGYLGVLPDYLYANSRSIKVGWLSCFWVDEEFRSSPVTAGLLLEIMDAWNRNILITNFVPSLLPLYRKSGFFGKEMILQGIRCYLRLNLAEVLPTKKKVFRNLKFLLAGTDAVFNLFADLRFILFKNVPADPSIYDLRSHLDRDLYEPVEYFNRDSLSRRGVEEINWILDYPWILEKKPDAESSKYYFSSVSRRFFYRIIRVKKVKSNRPGFVLVCVRDNHMTVPYLFSDEYIIIARILVNLMIELRCSMLTIFHVKLIPSISKIRSPFLFRKVIRKPYLISRNLGIDGDLKFQDGDGDCAFY